MRADVSRWRDRAYPRVVAATNPDSTPSWARWLQERLDERGWAQADLYNRSGGAITRARVSRWIGGATPDVDGICAACAVLGVPVGAAMIESGLLQPEDIDGITVVQRRPLTKRELLAELDRRLPADQEDADVTPLRPELRPDTIGEQWAARRFPPRK